MLSIYNLLVRIFWPLLYLYPPFRGTIAARRGYFEPEGYDPSLPGMNVLINAVSAGEVVAISSFIRELRQAIGECNIVLLTTTQSGRTMAQGKLAGLVEYVAWFPLVDRNPQKFVDIYNCSEADFQKATHRVYHEGGHASYLEVGVLK